MTLMYALYYLTSLCNPPFLPPPKRSLFNSVNELKALITQWGNESHRQQLVGVVEKQALVALAVEACEWANQTINVLGQVKKRCYTMIDTIVLCIIRYFILLTSYHTILTVTHTPTY